MSTHKNFDKICCVILAVVLVISVLFCFSENLGVTAAAKTTGYENRIFSTDIVHSIDIIMEDWDSFIETCENEEYAACSLVIDNEAYKNVAIRAKGNTSLSSVSSMDSDRYSFKIEFDHYDKTKTYHGLDKLCLNNLIQDYSLMKDYLTYNLMRKAGAAAPFCSFVYVTVNGEDFGLYLAVEAIEDSFLSRNYGNDTGNLYKPDSMSFGGGKGNGKNFSMSDFNGKLEEFNNQQEVPDNSDSTDSGEAPEIPENSEGITPPDFGGNRGVMPEGFEGMTPPDFGGNRGGMPEGFEGMTPPDFGGNSSGMPEIPQNPTGTAESSETNASESEAGRQPAMNGGFNRGNDGVRGGMASSDVKLQYTDDSFESYSNIFDSAKTDISDSDKERLIASLKKLSEGGNMEGTVDIEAVIRYFVVHDFVQNGDSYTGSMIHNYYLYEENGVLSMLPWDYNLAFGGFDGGANATSSINSPIDSPVSGGNTEDRPMVNWIFSSEEYLSLYHEIYESFIAEVYESGYLSELIDNCKTLIAPYVEKDPTKFCTYEEFEKGAEALKEYCILRCESVKKQLQGEIPATEAERSGSGYTLVDGSSLSLYDMGGMNTTHGNMRNEVPDGGSTAGGFMKAPDNKRHTS